ncbi:hypothetical protein HPB47_010317 [Ixodes persulcatus]|uniref:Uncharacterized protein n=1 Tax=Ixodes persulcatus TaxID=34615 RepID=A0AC60NZD8_IXOPE|nr:hypothetical protein HPB47_010317 [Ixodes persulcatus]
MKEAASTSSSVFLDQKLRRSHPYDTEDVRKNGKDPPDSRKLKSCSGGSAFSTSEEGSEPGLESRPSVADVNVAAAGPGAAGNFSANDAVYPAMVVSQADADADESAAAGSTLTPKGSAAPTGAGSPAQRHSPPLQVYRTPSPALSYRVNVRPREPFDMTQVPGKVLQTVTNQGLQTTGYRGYEVHRPSNSITLHVATLEDAVRMCQLSALPLSEKEQLPRQAYLASGPDITRCVVSRLHPEDPSENILSDLHCSSHKVIAARRLGKRDSYLLMLQGPEDIPDIVYYCGGIFRPRPYRPKAIVCYKCCQLGHMQTYCPQAKPNTDLVTQFGQPRYQCGLCKTDDHHITSPNCSRERQATLRSRNKTGCWIGSCRRRIAPAQETSATEIDQQIERLTRDIARSQELLQQLQARRQQLRIAPARPRESQEHDFSADDDTQDVQMTTHQLLMAIYQHLKGSPRRTVLQWNCRGLAARRNELLFRMQYGIIKPWACLLQETHGKPGSARLNFGWIQHLCRRYLHVPVLVGGDFNAPHTSWGYATDSGRGRQVYSRFRDSSYVLLNEAHVSTRPLTAPNTPDLTWWQGHGLPRWTAEPDCWGSDHTPIHIHLSHHLVKKQRRMTKVINWTELRTSTTLEGATADSIMLELKQVVHKHTTEQTVNQDQPNPDLHLIRLWDQRKQAELQARSLLHNEQLQWEPRIIYQAQFQNLTETQWNSLETVNRAAMRSITGLPMHTPIKLLQEHAHLNTLRQLCDQRTQARVAKHQLYASESHKETSYIDKIQQLPPWSFSCLTTNKTSRRKARQNPKAHNPNPSSPDHCILYTDAACTQNGGATAFVSRTHPHLDDQKKFATSDASPLLLELQAIYEALLAASKDHSIAQVTIFTDSAQAIRHLKQTKQAMNIVQKINRLRHHFAGMVVIEWVQGHGTAEGNIAAHEAAKRAAQSEDLQSHTLPMDLVATLLATRVPPGLSRLQEVLLRRIRTGCAITPAVLSSWRGDHSRIPPACPHCPAPADQVDVRHLIWTCPGIRADREHYVLQAGIRWDDPEAYKTWTTNNVCARSLLDFVHTAGLPAFL